MQEDTAKTRDELLRELAALRAENEALHEKISQTHCAGVETLKEMLRSLGDGYIVLDRDLQVLEHNQRRRSGDLAQDSTIGTCCHHIFHGRQKSCPDCPARKALASGKMAQGVLVIEEPDQAPRSLDLYALPLIDAAGTCIGVLEYSRDTSAQRSLKEQYETLFESMPDGIALHEAIYDDGGEIINYRFLHINSAFEALTGLKRGDLLNRTVLEVIPETEAHWIQTYGRVVKSGEPIQFENYSGALGRYYKVLAYRPAPHRFITVFTDITEHRRIVTELRDREVMLQTLFRAAPIGIGMSKNRVLGWVNEGICRLIGYRAEELEGKNASILYPNEEEYHRVGRMLEPLAKNESMDSVETYLRHKTGYRIQVLLNASAMSSEKEDGAAIFTILDISERQRAEKALEKSEHMLSVNNRIATLFLSSPENLVYEHVLAVVQKTIPSSCAYFALISETELLQCVAYAAQEQETDPMQERSYPKAQWRGFWGESLRNKTVRNLKAWVEFPGQSRRLEHGLAVPILHRDKIIGQFVLAGRNEAYSFFDQQLLSSIAAQVAPILDARIKTQQHKRDKALLEKQMRQSQKMEALGQLSAGIAHDFNNILQIISGNTFLALDAIDAKAPETDYLQSIEEATDRAVQLVRGLLTFSRQIPSQPQYLSVNETLEGFMRMLRRVIGEDIELIRHTEESLPTVFLDPSELEQILMNLCVNARDAMPQGGRITIRTGEIYFDQAMCETEAWAQPGNYLCLQVADTGKGIAAEIQERIFEPFFTTKDIGKGTGIGLATVYGIVKRHLGGVRIESAPEKGSSFKIYLPAQESPRTTKSAPPQHLFAPGQGETILVAEDDAMVRELAVNVLEWAGYQVLEASDGHEALELINAHGEEIHLAILDVIMPKLSGKAVYDAISRQGLNIPVLFSSGYSHKYIEDEQFSLEKATLIQKPYNPDELRSRVSSLLAKGKSDRILQS